MGAADSPPPAGWVRDHLANERTLLAWVRTSLSFMAFGVAVAKLGVLVHIAALDHPELADELPSPVLSEIVGVVLIAFGGLLSLAGLVKSRRWSAKIHPDLEPPSQKTLLTLALLTTVVAIGLTLYVLLG